MKSPKWWIPNMTWSPRSTGAPWPRSANRPAVPQDKSILTSFDARPGPIYAQIAFNDISWENGAGRHPMVKRTRYRRGVACGNFCDIPKHMLVLAGDAMLIALCDAADRGATRMCFLDKKGCDARSQDDSCQGRQGAQHRQAPQEPGGVLAG